MRRARDSFVDFVVDQLSDVDSVECRAMFGGHGLYSNRAFFGIVHKDRLYFLTDESSRAAYVAQKMRPFRPTAKQTLANYYEVPADIVEDRHHLATWARAAIACQHRKAKRPARGLRTDTG